MRIIISITLFCAVLLGNAQTKVSINLRLTYKYTYISDSTKPLQTKSDLMYLDIVSDTGSIYYSKDVDEKRKLLEKDEFLINEMIKSGSIDGSKFAKYSSEGVDDIVIKKYSTNELTFGTWVGLHFYYSETFSGQNWEYMPDTSTITGFACQKAICRYGNRTYNAWFSKTVDITDGPWKFSGLPGVIVKIFDTQNYFLYELQDIKLITEQPFTLQLDSKEYKKTAKKDLLRLMKEYFEDEMGTIQRVANFSSGVTTKRQSAPKYYNPQERE
jgi:GLPGLI family protein